jgi:hypothetical protein
VLSPAHTRPPSLVHASCSPLNHTQHPCPVVAVVVPLVSDGVFGLSNFPHDAPIGIEQCLGVHMMCPLARAHARGWLEARAPDQGQVGGRVGHRRGCDAVKCAYPQRPINQTGASHSRRTARDHRPAGEPALSVHPPRLGSGCEEGRGIATHPDCTEGGQRAHRLSALRSGPLRAMERPALEEWETEFFAADGVRIHSYLCATTRPKLLYASRVGPPHVMCGSACWCECSANDVVLMPSGCGHSKQKGKGVEYAFLITHPHTLLGGGCPLYKPWPQPSNWNFTRLT